MKLVSMILPNKQAIPELFSQLEVIAKQSGVQIVGMSVAEKEEEPRSARARAGEDWNQAQAQKLSNDIKQLSIQFDVNAINYDIFKNFIDSIQSNSRILDIERFTYNPNQDTQGITIRTYYLETD